MKKNKQEKNKPKINQINERCYRVYHQSKFKVDLAQTRALFDLPAEGLDSEESYINWWHEKDMLGQGNTFRQHCVGLVQKYQLPPDANMRLKDHILFGTSGLRPESLDVFVPLDELGVCDIQFFGETNEEWVKSNIPFVRVVISDFAGVKDATNYIEAHWGIIQRLLDIQRGDKPKPSVVRTLKNREIQDEILKLNKLSLRELRKKAPLSEFPNDASKPATIAVIINAQYGAEDSSVDFNEESVKKTITRRNKGH